MFQLDVIEEKHDYPELIDPFHQLESHTLRKIIDNPEHSPLQPQKPKEFKSKQFSKFFEVIESMENN